MLGDRVLVALPPVVDEIQTASGIVLVKDPDRFQTPTRGIVVALGERPRIVSLDDVLGVFDELTIKEHVLNLVNLDLARDLIKVLAPAPFDVQVDDMVLFPASAGEQIEEDGIRYVILRESEIIGIQEKETAA